MMFSLSCRLNVDRPRSFYLDLFISVYLDDLLINIREANGVLKCHKTIFHHAK